MLWLAVGARYMANKEEVLAVVCTRTNTGYHHPPRIHNDLDAVAARFLSGSDWWRRLVDGIAGGSLGGGREAKLLPSPGQ